MKTYKINFKKSPYNPEYYGCEVRFKANADEGIPLRDILDALTKTDQTKLARAFKSAGVSVFISRGYMLCSIGERTYSGYLQQFSSPIPLLEWESIYKA